MLVGRQKRVLLSIFGELGLEHFFHKFGDGRQEGHWSVAANLKAGFVGLQNRDHLCTLPPSWP